MVAPGKRQMACGILPLSAAGKRLRPVAFESLLIKETGGLSAIGLTKATSLCCARITRFWEHRGGFRALSLEEFNAHRFKKFGIRKGDSSGLAMRLVIVRLPRWVQ